MNMYGVSPTGLLEANLLLQNSLSLNSQDGELAVDFLNVDGKVAVAEEHLHAMAN